MYTPCQWIDITHHLMVWFRLLIQYVPQCIHMSCIYVYKRGCTEVDICSFTRLPLIEGSIQLRKKGQISIEFIFSLKLTPVATRHAIGRGILQVTAEVPLCMGKWPLKRDTNDVLPPVKYSSCITVIMWSLQYRWVCMTSPWDCRNWQHNIRQNLELNVYSRSLQRGTYRCNSRVASWQCLRFL